MDKLNGWHLVALVFIGCTTLVLLVALGQELGAIASVGLMILSVLGFSAAQQYKNNAVSVQQLGEVKTQVNGNNEALRNQMAFERTQAALERQQMRDQLDAAHRTNVALAALVPPDTKVPEELSS